MVDGFLRGYRVRRAGGRGKGAKIVNGLTREDRVELASLVDWGETAGPVLVEILSPEEAPILAARLMTGSPLGRKLPRSRMRLATTRGTNCLLEETGARTALFVTRGFEDLLRIGDQRRPDLFALAVDKPPPLHAAVVEVDERLSATGEVLQSVDLADVEDTARKLLRRGIEAAAVALLHSHRNPEHERVVGKLLRRLGFRHVALSTELAPFIRFLPRAETALVDAYLRPVMEVYLDRVHEALRGGHLSVMTSAGSLIGRRDFHPKDGLLSGPAGGVVGMAAVAGRAGYPRAIGFDMGGTSTDVARFDGTWDRVFEHRVGRARLMAPALKLESVAAGGGSICGFDGQALMVGPESAGSQPGPACYGAGGPLTLTDVNLLLGRLDPDRFGVPVDRRASERMLDALVDRIGQTTGSRPDAVEVLRGFLEIADERMANAIRRISVREGYDPGDYALVAFGGAGGLHGCAVAAHLGMDTILHPADSGVLSAWGLREARPERIAEVQVLARLDAFAGKLPALVRRLAARAASEIRSDPTASAVRMKRSVRVELRLSGQDATLEVFPRTLSHRALRRVFNRRYSALFGYHPPNLPLEIVAVRVAVESLVPRRGRERFPSAGRRVRPADGFVFREDLRPGDRLAGPLVVQDRFSSVYIDHGWRGSMGSLGTLRLRKVRSSIGKGSRPQIAVLELFTHRFQSIVEESGELLRRTALSTNIRERLDFSCGLLDPRGRLVANAPHIPVHLGALGMCVRRVTAALRPGPGDIVVTNHPGFGGSHLPDITVIAPVHARSGKLLGYVANRAHHAEIGGVSPGSMPPRARNLSEEGVVLSPMFLARNAELDVGPVEEALRAAPWPSRRVEENLADLHAQVAALRRSADLLKSLADEHGPAMLARQMDALRRRSASALRERLREWGREVRRARDTLDDGAPLEVALTFSDGRLKLDFAGSGGMHPGNLNATPAIVSSAVVYVLRLLVREPLPLNEGLLAPVGLRLPRGLLNPLFSRDPGKCPAVAGGNVETSQRVVDLLLTAFGVCASSQGTMNNLLFGNGRVSYYETLGGGTGAGVDFDGASGVQCHMTNTAVTDPEILETRYPVRLMEFSIRRGSGGRGRHRGGDGLRRKLQFLEPVEVSLITQRRTRGAPGLDGGTNGKPGRQWVERRSGKRERLPGIAAVNMETGDVLVIETPGGGGARVERVRQ